MSGQRPINRPHDRLLAERLWKASHGSSTEHACAHRVFGVGGDEYGWHGETTADQFLLDVGSRQSRHLNVQEDAFDALEILGCQKFLA